MNDTAQPHDELDALLGGEVSVSGGGDPSHALREALRGKSTAAFVRRRRRRRAFRVAGMAACYLMGVVTIYAFQQVSAMPADRTASGDTTAATATAATTTDAPGSAKRADSTPVERRQIAAGEPENEHVRAALLERPKIVKKSRFDSLRELGDRHLLGDRNPERALRCYRMALRYATEEERESAAQDGTWLLRVICLDAKQEHEHASKS
ncbi:MAG: hypothetical protein WD875_18700 [Pirellulales bacterium]